MSNAIWGTLSAGGVRVNDYYIAVTETESGHRITISRTGYEDQIIDIPDEDMTTATEAANTAASAANTAAQSAMSAADSGVRTDQAQSLTDAQKTTARTNIDAANQTEIQGILAARGGVDVVGFMSLAPNTDKGVDFVRNEDGTWTVSGTATGLAIHNFYYGLTSLPAWLVKGHSYNVEYQAQNVNLQVWFYKGGTYYAGNTYKANSSFIVPTDAEGAIVRLSVPSGVSADETVAPHIFSAPSNSDIQAQLAELESDAIPYRGIWPNGDSVDNITNTGVYLITGNSSAPAPYGTLFNLMASDVTRVQIMFALYGLVIYYRRYTNGWQGWSHLNRLYKPNPYYRDKTYLAFGDSLTYGALWNTGTGGETVQTRATEGSRIPDRIANAVNCANYTNHAVGGMGYCKEYEHTPTFLEYIKTVDISNANLITIMGGRNDGGYSLGTSDSQAGEATICGQIAAIINYIRSVNSTCQIVVIQATPYAQPGENPFTKVYAGNWSLDTFDEQVSQLCKNYSVGYCTWYGCSLFATWGEQSGGGGNYAHMREDSQYEQMGDFIAGQVARWFVN